MAVSRLREQVADWKAIAEFDQPARLLRNIALSGCESKNGYRYAESALRRAARLYDQKPVFLDHAGKPTEPAARSTRDLVGSIVNPRFDEGRLRGDVRVLDTESGRTFLALVDGNTPGVGMSHVVLAERSRDGGTVERIEEVISVDVVVRPATTSTFRESEEDPPERAEVEFRDDASGMSPMLTESSGGDSHSAGSVENLLSRLVDVLERFEARLKPPDGRSGAGAGAGVQDEAHRRREANVPADRGRLEGGRPERATSSARRGVEQGFSRGAFLAAIRGR